MNIKKDQIEYETVAKFKDDNCNFTIMQPIKQNSSAEKKYKNALAKAAFRQHFKP